MTRQQPRPSPYQWLWKELARRYGDDVAREIKAGYLEQNKAYQRAVWDGVTSPPQPRAKRQKQSKRQNPK